MQHSSFLLLILIITSPFAASFTDIVGNITDAAKKTLMDNLPPIASEMAPYIYKQFVYGKIHFILYNEHRTNGTNFTLTNYTNMEINISRTSKFLIHGWNSNGDSPMPITLKNEYVKLKLYNIVVVDWGKVAEQLLYPVPANGTEIVGEYIADLLLKLYENSTSKNINVHLVGYSLGAHVAGFAGRKLRQHGFTVDRITALDPAKPLIYDGVRAADGAFVDVIHTTSGFTGKPLPLGHADFYPNGGIPPQPHCNDILMCSHSRSWQYFAKTINTPRNYLAYRCKSFTDYLIGVNCDDEVYMGEGLSNNARGVYYLKADDIYY